jgi:hypothetical protein
MTRRRTSAAGSPGGAGGGASAAAALRRLRFARCLALRLRGLTATEPEAAAVPLGPAAC